MNLYAIRAIYLFEMSRTFRTLLQSIISPVISTALYFIVFGSAIGSRMVAIEGVSYGAFIVPGLIMLTVLMQSVPTPHSGFTSQNSSARFMSLYPRLSLILKLWLVMSARRRPNLLSSGSLFWPLPFCLCRSKSHTPSGCWAF